MSPKQSDPGRDHEESDEKLPARRAGLLQVTKTLFFGLFAIGMKGTWNKDGAKVTPVQIVVGAILGGIVLVAILIAIVRVVLRFATG